MDRASTKVADVPMPDASPAAAQWTIKDVFEWAKTKVSETHATKLQDQEIDGDVLLKMNAQTFERCGIPVGPALKLEEAVVKLRPAQPAQVGAPLQVPSADLMQLWQDLYEATVTEDGEFLQIKEANPQRLPFSGNLLYIRQSYKDIFSIIQASTEFSRFLLLGNPGIGKSCFFIYFLYRLLKENQTVVLQRHGELGGACYLFTNQQVASTSNIGDYAGILNNPHVWYLVDTVSDPGTVMARTILTCSPNREHFKQFEKYQQRITLYFPIWSSLEVKILRNTVFANMPEATMDERFGKVGGIPRLIFSTTDLDKAIEAAMGRSSFDNCTESSGMLEGSDDLSHVLIHIVATLDYKDYSVHYGSTYIADKLVEHFERKELEKLRALLWRPANVLQWFV